MHEISLLRTQEWMQRRSKLGEHLYPGLCRAYARGPEADLGNPKASATPKCTASAPENHLRALNVWKNQTRFRPRDIRGKLLFKVERTAKGSGLQDDSWGRGGNREAQQAARGLGTQNCDPSTEISIPVAEGKTKTKRIHHSSLISERNNHTTCRHVKGSIWY